MFNVSTVEYKVKLRNAKTEEEIIEAMEEILETQYDFIIGSPTWEMFQVLVEEGKSRLQYQ